MRQTNPIPLLALTFLMALTGCNQTAPAAQPNTQATIDAAVAATDAAQAGMQATIDAAVAATTQAQAAAAQPADAAPATIDAPATAPAESQPVETAVATPTPAAEYAALTEEELAALIDQTVTQAVAASEASAAAASQAASDGNVTSEEVQTVEVYVAGAEEAVALAEEMLAAYYSLYGDLAQAGVEELDDVEQALLAVAASTAALNATLQSIDSSLTQGVTLATETISQLEATAQTVQTHAQQLQAAQQLAQNNLPETAPLPGSGDPQAALQSVFEFSAAGQQATGDGQVSPEELAQLAQLAGAVSANLNATGNPQLQDLDNVIQMVNGHLEGGNVPQAQAGLEQLGLAATLATPPTQVASNPAAAIQAALEFAALGQQLSSGGQPSPAQLAQLAQLGANASAGLNASGMPQLQQLSGQVTDIAGKISVGQGPQAQMQLQQLSGSLSAIPNIELPKLPDKPGRK